MPMYVQTLLVDNWEGTHNREQSIDDPSWDEIESRIRALDGERYTLILLIGQSESHMAVGGGPAQYIVYATFDGQHFEQLYTQQLNQQSEPRLYLMVGGQEGDYASEMAVSLKEALLAARAFALDGTLSAALNWMH